MIYEKIYDRQNRKRPRCFGIVSVELSSLPKNIREGDILRFDENSCFLSEAETQRRKEKIKQLMDKLFEE